MGGVLLARGRESDVSIRELGVFEGVRVIGRLFEAWDCETGGGGNSDTTGSRKWSAHVRVAM